MDTTVTSINYYGFSSNRPMIWTYIDGQYVEAVWSPERGAWVFPNPKEK